jgi:hypothetical protein
VWDRGCGHWHLLAGPRGRGSPRLCAGRPSERAARTSSDDEWLFSPYPVSTDRRHQRAFGIAVDW